MKILDVSLLIILSLNYNETDRDSYDLEEKLSLHAIKLIEIDSLNHSTFISLRLVCFDSHVS
jgi:hypothetical protein